MARPRKNAIDYFPFNCDTFNDDRIVDLMEQHGPRGFAVYMCLLCTVFSHGFYVEMSIDKMSRLIMRQIGSRYVSRPFVSEVITTLGELGLVDNNALLHGGVFTSLFIQKEYERICCRRKFDKGKFWLLDDEDSKKEEFFKHPYKEPLLKSAKKTVNGTLMGVSATETPVYVDNNPHKVKEKVKDYIYSYISNSTLVPEPLKDALTRFIVMRCLYNGVDFYEGDIDVYMEQLYSLSDDTEEQIKIINQSTVKRWNGFFPLKKIKLVSDNTTKRNGKPVNSFHDFNQGEAVDYDELLPKEAHIVSFEKRG